MQSVSISVSAVLFSLALAPLAAQEGPPAPADELKKLAVFEGNWVGEGTATMMPGQEPAAWTSKTTYRWALGGHFLQEDTIVEGEGMPAPMVFRSYLGWDREHQRYVAAMMGNSGEAHLTELHWLDDHTLVNAFVTKREGIPGLEHSVSKIEGDTITFEMSSLQGAGPMMTTVKGTLKRVADAEPVALEASHSMAPAPAEMARIARICGTYSLTGEMVPAPGAPAMKIRGEESIESIFGDTVLVAKVTGQAEGMPGDYEAWSCITWDPAEKCYRHLAVDNMGMIGESEGRFVGVDKIVHTVATLEFGLPVVMRTLLHLGSDGSIARVENHAIRGTEEPQRIFVGTYEKKK